MTSKIDGIIISCVDEKAIQEYWKKAQTAGIKVMAAVHPLPCGTPEEDREEVLRSCEVFGRNGGFIFNKIHNIQYGTPVLNIVSMIDPLKEFNKK